MHCIYIYTDKRRCTVCMYIGINEERSIIFSDVIEFYCVS